MTVVPVPDAPLGFDDAVGIAFALSDRYLFTQAALLLDQEMRCIDLEIFSAPGDKPWHSHLDAPGATANLLGAACRSASRALVSITVGVVDREVLYEADLEHFRATSRLAQLCGFQLLDWIVTDGDLVRSYAELTGRNWAILPRLDY